MGTPIFSVPILKSLYQNGYPVSVVYTQPPNKSQRGQKLKNSPIHNISEILNLEVRTPLNLKNNENEYNYLKNLNADLAIVVAYGQIIPEEFLNLTKLSKDFPEHKLKNKAEKKKLEISCNISVE